MITKPSVYTKQLYNVLVIEDLPSWQRKFRRYLDDKPFNVVVAATAQETLYLCEVYVFDLLILDVNLSGVPHNIDGLRVANHIWRKNKDIKIIIVSGEYGWNWRLGGYNFEPSHIFEKHKLDHDDFVQKIYQVLIN